MQYMIVEAETADKMKEIVQDLIDADWRPQGGVSVVAVHYSWTNERKGHDESATEWVFYQAMKR